MQPVAMPRISSQSDISICNSSYSSAFVDVRNGLQANQVQAIGCIHWVQAVFP